jgi:hypothetical protein
VKSAVVLLEMQPKITQMPENSQEFLDPKLPLPRITFVKTVA